MKRPLHIIILTILAITKAKACDCVYYHLEKSISITDFILIGKFIQGEKLWELSEMGHGAATLYYTGKFIVTKVVKGRKLKVGDTLLVSSDFSNCSTLYKNNTNYLLFASFKEGELKTSICSYTGMLDNEDTQKVYKQTTRLMKKRLL